MVLTKADRISIQQDMGQDWLDAVEYAISVLGNYVYLEEVFWGTLAKSYNEFNKTKANAKTFLCQRVRFACLNFARDMQKGGGKCGGGYVTVSISSLVDDGESKAELLDTLFEPLDDLPNDSAVIADLSNQAINLLDELSDNEKYVIAERFWRGKKLKDISAVLNVTIERVRQLEFSALRKLRARLKV